MDCTASTNSEPLKIIALCGHPKHGKSTVQSMLAELGVRPRDDGLPIRLAGMERFGLTWEQVSTQEGKLEICHAFGRDMEVREALGLIGKEHEDTDPGYWAREALKLAQADPDRSPVSFGSVRRTQGHVYREAGGIVLEIRDPRKPESPYDFDQYDPAAVTHTIINDGTLEDLRTKVFDAVADYLDMGPDLEAEQMVEDFRAALTANDIEVLEQHSGEELEAFDRVLALLALEHFGRFEALVHCHSEEQVARNLLLMMSRRALTAAQVIQERIDAQVP